VAPGVLVYTTAGGGYAFGSGTSYRDTDRGRDGRAGLGRSIRPDADQIMNRLYLSSNDLGLRARTRFRAGRVTPTG